MRALVITMLDLEKEANQRTHHVVRMISGFADETTVIFRERAMDRSWRGLLRDAASFRWRVSRNPEASTIAVHPPLNYAQAVAAGLVEGVLEREASAARRATAAFLSLLGIARDLVLVPGVLVAALVTARGTHDLCIAEGPWSAAVGWALRRVGRVRRLVYDDIDFVAGGQRLRLRYAYVAWLERVMIARADLVISAGWLLGTFRRRTTGREAIVIPNGVEVSRFAPARTRRPHPPTLTYVGNIAHYAGIDLVIRAMPMVREAVPDARLLVVGGGDPPYVEGLKRLAASLGLTEHVLLPGPVAYASVPDVLSESDVGLATFRNNPLGDYAFPLKVVEYMAAGLPVLCTTGSESAELVRRTGCGHAVDFDEARLAEGAVRLLSDGAHYERLKCAAIAAADGFSWSRLMREHRAAIAAILT